jgi:hypothetical protein
MNQFNNSDTFNCNYGCQNENQCQYYNNLPMQQMQSVADNTNYYIPYDDSAVVPVNYFENQQIPTYSNATYENVQTTSGYFTDCIQSNPPCKGPQPWNYAQCYGYYGGEAPCQFANVVDMEDFM